MKKFLFLLLGANLMGAPVWVNKGEAPKGLVRSAYQDTGSMRPALRGDGSVLGTAYTSSTILKVGDWVCLYRASDGKAVLHEITALNERAVYTSGISSRWADGWSPRSAVFLVVRYIERQPVTSLAQVR